MGFGFRVENLEFRNGRSREFEFRDGRDGKLGNPHSSLHLQKRPSL